MPKNPYLSIVIPLYNEKENIAPLLKELTSFISAFDKKTEVVIIDDGSTDGSYESLKENRPAWLRLVRLGRNTGQTAAMMAGFNLSRGEYVAALDADLQNDAKDIPRLFQEMKRHGYDVVSGWRKKRRDSFLSRRLPSIIANGIISRVMDCRLHDYGCTLKLYRRATLKDLRLYGEMHRFIPALLKWNGASVGELAVNHRSRQRGHSKYGLWRTLRVVLDLINLKFLQSYSTSPIQIFGGIGMVTLLLAGLSGIAMIAMKLLQGTDMTGNPLTLLAVLLTVIGIQFITLGLLAEITVRTYHESQAKDIYNIKEIVE